MAAIALICSVVYVVCFTVVCGTYGSPLLTGCPCVGVLCLEVFVVVVLNITLGFFPGVFVVIALLAR